MNYDKHKSIQILQRTPVVLKELLNGLDEEWIMGNEGPQTFSPYDVVGHLLHGERTDWPVRINLILDKGLSQPFEPYDRFAMYHESKGKTIQELLNEFARLRKKNLFWFSELHLEDDDCNKEGMHPSLGVVTLRQLLSTWVVHDLTHIAQITRVMAKQYKEEVGPWAQYFRILNW